jgi:hypothetical protein
LRAKRWGASLEKMMVLFNIRGMEGLIGGPQAQRLPDIQIVATAIDKAKKSRHYSRDFFLDHP